MAVNLKDAISSILDVGRLLSSLASAAEDISTAKTNTLFESVSRDRVKSAMRAISVMYKMTHIRLEIIHTLKEFLSKDLDDKSKKDAWNIARKLSEQLNHDIERFVNEINKNPPVAEIAMDLQKLMFATKILNEYIVETDYTAATNNRDELRSVLDSLVNIFAEFELLARKSNVWY